ncbi:FkbM family methyltransferase [Nodularia harveyana UHCC-0300]|uniref:FkbM family methyltransferase n=1 Tax=Nodularia harveyana UHCC-0300 TaxID=2974287 RepID=A0ABU5UCL3_9CYAN|nr:FkbM family methyltransferase [Nodularia harveyana]MEA5581273.1 FkbM family methyltransferase [Nodularia harveyana UHCC-0300]
MFLKIGSKISFHISLLKDYFLAFQSWSLEKRTLARRKLAWHFIQGQSKFITFQRDDNWWTVFSSDVVSRHLFFYGKFELNSLDATLRWLGKNHNFWLKSKAIINVGGNIGATCIPLARKTGKHCIVCEPVPETFKLLEQNIKLNNLTELISCHQIGISSRPGYAEMALTGDSGWSEVRVVKGVQGFSNLSPVYNYVKVPMSTLEELVTMESLNLQDVGLVWSDTQGFESEVIESGKALWLAGVPCWVEVWPQGLEAHGGIRKFVALCNEYFQYLITKEDFDNLNEIQPKEIKYLEKLIHDMQNSKNPEGTDILLIP